MGTSGDAGGGRRSGSRRRRRPSRGAVAVAWLLIGVLAAGVGASLLALLLTVLAGIENCGAPPAGGIVVGPPGQGQLVGATEYGGPADPSSGVVGASGVNLLQHPDSYAELGGTSFQTARAMGGLPYMAPVRVTWGQRSAIAYKRDFGLGGGPVAGLPRVIDLWWQFASTLGIPYSNGLWSGPVRVERPPAAGAGNILGQTVSPDASLTPAAGGDPAACAAQGRDGVPLTSGDEAKLLPDGRAAAPADAPPAVKEIIAAGNQIVGKPYAYGGGHGLPLSTIAPAYDCSSSVAHLLYGARLISVTYDVTSSGLESFGAAGPGTWVSIYASASHAFMYVAGLRWDTHNAGGTGDGSSGIGWHPLIRSAAGFVARHPEGL